jgi:DNA-3-methyladenine glycosylase
MKGRTDMTGKRLTAADYRGTAPEMAPRLLGKLICRRIDDRDTALIRGHPAGRNGAASINAAESGAIMYTRITETEAYYGQNDSACHARFGRTPRTAVMFKPGGFAYIYLCYGIHWMLNIVTGPEDFPEAVLIRGVEGFPGPGRLTKALFIDGSLNGENLAVSETLWIEDDGQRPEYLAGPRTGIGYAAPEDQALPWRFTVVRDTAVTPGYDLPDNRCAR